MDKDALNRNDWMMGIKNRTEWPIYKNTIPSPFEDIVFPEFIQVVSLPIGKDEIVAIKILKPEDYNGVYSGGKMSKRVLNLFFERQD
jgi:hypothetical protein